MKNSKILLAGTFLLTSLTLSNIADAATNYKDIDYSKPSVIKNIKNGTLTKVNGVTLNSKLSSYSRTKYYIGDVKTANFISINGKDMFEGREFNSLTAAVDFSDNKTKPLKVTRFVDNRTGRGFTHPKKFTYSKMRSLYGKPTRTIEIMSAYEEGVDNAVVDFYKNVTFMYRDFNGDGKLYLDRTYILGEDLKKQPKKWQAFVRSLYKHGESDTKKVSYSYWYGKN